MLSDQYRLHQLHSLISDLFLVSKSTSLPSILGSLVQGFFEKNSISQIGRSLNIYQKYAVESSLNEDTLIHGPPGTGTSETIANIIANVMINMINYVDFPH